jgi:hypothetical protein
VDGGKVGILLIAIQRFGFVYLGLVLWMKTLMLPPKRVPKTGCLSKVTITNSGRMFQTVPDSWEEQFLVERNPVSFHKHGGCDPEEVYRTWFEESDMGEGSGGRNEL